MADSPRRRKRLPIPHGTGRRPSRVPLQRNDITSVNHQRLQMPAPLLLMLLLGTPLSARAEDLILLLEERHCPNCQLADSDLVHADLRNANLKGAQLQRANLSHVLLDGADLNGSDLRFTSLQGASLRGATSVIAA